MCLVLRGVVCVTFTLLLWTKCWAMWFLHSILAYMLVLLMYLNLRSVYMFWN